MNNNSSAGAPSETATCNNILKEMFEDVNKYYNSGKLEEAQECLAKILKNDPSNEEANLMLAQTFLDTQNFEEAIAAYYKVIKLNSKCVDAYQYLGIAYFRVNKIKESLTAFDQAININPENHELWAIKGDVYSRINELENAINCYTKAIEINPNDIETYKELSKIYSQNKDYDSALSVWDHAIKVNPQNDIPLCYKGDIYKYLKEPEKAKECYDGAIAINPKCAVAYTSLGILCHSNNENLRKDRHHKYINHSNIDEAISLYEKAVETDPKYDLPYFNLGLAYLELDCLEDALCNFQRHLVLNVNNLEAWYYKAIIEERLHKYNEALFALRVLINRADRRNAANSELLNNAYQKRDALLKQEYENTPLLNKFGKDITRLAATGNIGYYVGRKKELMQITQILSSKSKNDVLIIGEPGVGKSALIEALAAEIIFNSGSHVLSGYRLIELNFVLFVDTAGPSHLVEVINEAEANNNIILFIDEINKIAAYSDILKPAIENNKLIFITTTTLEGYQKLNQFDTTLERKFEKLILNEPSREETIEILSETKETFENYHKVSISKAAIESAVDLSIKFISERKLPDKAIDAIDKACADANINLCSLQENERRSRPPKEQCLITANDIASVISQKTSIPYEIIAGNLKQNNYSRITKLKQFLENNIFGQERAIKAITNRLTMAYSGLSKKRGPMSVFLFIGTNGIGKTEITRQLAKFLFGSENTIIWLSGFEDPNTIAKLSTHPHSIVLFDEIDKAPQTFVDTLLKVFDEGYISQPSGKIIDVSNTIFIMTSNLMPEKHISLGKAQPHHKLVLDDLKEYYRPEFINRIDEIIVFNKLTEANVVKILDKMILEFNETLAKQYEITLYFDDAVKKALVREGFSDTYGAGELRRSFEKMIKVPLSNIILEENISQHKNWYAVIGKDDEILITPKD